MNRKLIVFGLSAILSTNLLAYSEERVEIRGWGGSLCYLVGTTCKAVGNLVDSILCPKVVVKKSDVTYIPVVQGVIETSKPTKVWVSGHYEYFLVNGVLVKEWISGYYEYR